MPLKHYDLIHGEVDKVQIAIDRLRAFEPLEGLMDMWEED